MKNLGIYIQVPFCQTRCTYCNFHTGVVSADRFAPYIQAVQRELASSRDLLRAAGVLWPRGFDWQSLCQTQIPFATVDTVYIGGGTPSLLEPKLLGALLSSIGKSFPCSWEEVTLEADPETIEIEKIHHWIAVGINRISFGAQSFVDSELKATGRMHRRADIYKAVPLLRDAGLRNISFDLIAGLPKQTNDSWGHSLAETIALSPEHVSIYMMEIDEGSRLGMEVIQQGSRYSARDLPSEESMADFYELAQSELKAAGYEQYEISNWAKPGFASKHNLKYWRREPYLGFGAGAHSFFGKQRWANAHDAAEYAGAIQADRLPLDQLEPVTRDSALEEELFLGLRQLDGIDLGRIEREYGVALGARFGPMESAGLVERQGEIVRLSPAKLSVA